MGLLNDIGAGPVALDAGPLIYFIERHPRYLPIVRPVFVAINDGGLAAVTSGISLLETLVVPLRAANHALANRYEALLTRSRGLRLIHVDLDQLRGAAQLRAQSRLKTPDALQLAAALSAGCTALVTNDDRLPSFPGLRVLQLEAYLDPAA